MRQQYQAGSVNQQRRCSGASNKIVVRTGIKCKANFQMDRFDREAEAEAAAISTRNQLAPRRQRLYVEC